LNDGKSCKEQVKKSKVAMFCQKHIGLRSKCTPMNFDDMFEPITDCLQTISSAPFWDAKTSTDAYCMLKRVTDHTFIVCFQVILHMFGYIKGLSMKLQGSSLDIIQGYEMISQVKSMLKDARPSDEDWEHEFGKAAKMWEKASRAPIEIPRRCNRDERLNAVMSQQQQGQSISSGVSIFHSLTA